MTALPLIRLKNHRTCFARIADDAHPIKLASFCWRNEYWHNSALTELRTPSMAKAMARHILVKTEAEAVALKKRIAAGEAFDVLARKHSKIGRASCRRRAE